MRKGIIPSHNETAQKTGGKPASTAQTKSAGGLRRWTAFFILSAAATLLLFAGCPFSDLFSEYRGKNLAGEYGFDSGSWEMSTSDPNLLVFEAPSDPTALDTTGLPDGAESSGIYRLEIPNLMPNGDFEASTPGAHPTLPDAGWSAVNGSGSISYEVINAGGNEINTNTFHYTLADAVPPGEDRIHFDLPGELGAYFAAGNTYVVRLDIRADEEVSFEYSDILTPASGTFWIFPFDPTAGMTVRDFPSEVMTSEFAALSGYEHLTLGAVADKGQAVTQKAYIDNLRIVRSDTDQTLFLKVPVIDSSSDRPELLDGVYRFSLYVREDTTNTISGTGTKQNNRFPATGVSLRTGIAVEGEDPIYIGGPEAFHPDDPDTDWTGWTEISMEAQISFLSRGDPSTLFLVCGITPTDITSGGIDRDAGSILIAAPFLEFLPEGS
jgi:hypothetical protein